MLLATVSLTLTNGRLLPIVVPTLHPDLYCPSSMMEAFILLSTIAMPPSQIVALFTWINDGFPPFLNPHRARTFIHRIDLTNASRL